MTETTVMESSVAVADACSVVQGKGMAYRRPLLRLKIIMGGKIIASRLCRRQDQRLIAGPDDEDDGETVNGPPVDDDILDHDDACSRLEEGEISLLLQMKKKIKKMKKKMKKMKKMMKKKKKNPTDDDQILPKQSREIAEKAAAACTVCRLKIIHDGKAFVMGSRPEQSPSNQEDQERSSNYKSREDGTGDYHRRRQKRKHSSGDGHEEQPSMKKLLN